MIRPTNSPARDQRPLSFSDVGEDALPNPLISDFRVPAASKGTARDIWSRETLVKGTTREQSPAARLPTSESAPMIRSSTDGTRRQMVDPSLAGGNRPKALTPPTPPSATSKPFYESSNQYIAAAARNIPLAPRKSASLGPVAGGALLRPPLGGSDLKQKDMGSASVEVLRIFTEIENLEQKIRRSADKDAENLKLITTIETEVGGKDDHSLYMMPSMGNNDGSPPGSPRSPRSPTRSPTHHLNVYSKAIPSPPFSPTQIDF